MQTFRLNWRVVLVRPRNPLNIGAAARAMANFGLEDLVVVAPYEPVWQEARSAVGAGHILKSARAVKDLTDAAGDRTLVIGATTGGRRTLDRDLIALNDLAAWIEQRGSCDRAALVFGSEKAGLSNQHLSYCHALVRIPTVPRCPSMNLGQAVAVCCYELARSGNLRTGLAPVSVHRSDPASLQALEHVLARAVSVLDQTSYFTPKGREAQIVKLRRILLDLALTNHDVRVLGGVLAQIEWKLSRGDSR